jgi:hypothetical protein
MISRLKQISGVVVFLAAIFACISRASSEPTFEPFVFGELAATYTSNAFVADDFEKDDLFGAPKYGAGVAGKIGQFALGILSYDFRIYGSDARYIEFQERDGDSIGGQVNFQLSNGPWFFSLGYTPTAAYSPDYDEFLLGLHDFSFVAAYKAQINALTIQPALVAARRYSNEEVAERSSIGGRLTLTYPLSNTLAITASPSISYAAFDNFPGAQRNDMTYGISASAVIQLSSEAKFSMGISHIIRDSNIPGADAEVTNIGPTLGYVYKF